MAERREIEEKYRWDLGDLVPDEEEWERRFSALKRETGCLDKYRGKLDNAQTVLACFREEEAIDERLTQLAAYAKLRHDEDTRSAKYTAMSDRIDSLYTEFAAKASFVTPELVRLDDRLLAELAADPALEDYSYQLKLIAKEKPHTLSEGEERLLAESAEVTGGYHDVFVMIDNADLKLPTVDIDGTPTALTHAKYGLIMQSAGRESRKRAFEAYYTAYKDLLHAIATAYHYNVRKDWFYARARKYASCMEYAMSAEDADPRVYENLVAETDKNLAQLHRYVGYKKRALGLDKFYMYDMYYPIVPGCELQLSYEEAFKTVGEGLSVLGEEYAGLLDRAYSQRWIDVFETPGKRSGAYSMGIYSCHPYVLLNYERTTHNVFTIAHELGHALHSYYSSANQPRAKSDYVIFVAEVASTVNEVLLLKHIVKNTRDKALKRYLLSYFLEMLRTTLFRQTQFAEFEQAAHRMVENGEPLTSENLSELYLSLNKKYYGPEVEDDGFIQYEWARIPHFYRSFYVYKYATGIISAVSIAEGILAEGEPAVARYKKFLSSGASDSPVELLKIAGVDLTGKRPYERAMKAFAETLDELERG